MLRACFDVLMLRLFCQLPDLNLYANGCFLLCSLLIEKDAAMPRGRQVLLTGVSLLSSLLLALAFPTSAEKMFAGKDPETCWSASNCCFEWGHAPPMMLLCKWQYSAVS